MKRSLERIEHGAARAAFGLRNAVSPLVPDSLSVRLDGHVLDAELHLMLKGLELIGGASLLDGPVPKARAIMRRHARVHAGERTQVGFVRDLSIPGAAGPLRARHYVPDAPGGPHPLVVFYHGGGFALGDLDTHDEPCRVLCRTAQVHVLSVDYRLAPEHPFPAGVDDARAAFLWAHQHAAELGADPRRVGVSGDSAGANLATVVSLLTARAGDPVPALQILFYPVTDSTRESRSVELFAEGFFLTRADIRTFRQLYLGKFDDLADLRVSPLRAKDLSGMPPAIVSTAAFDPLRDEGEAYAEALLAAGNSVYLERAPTLVHGYINMGALSRVSKRTLLDLSERARTTFHSLAHSR